MHWFITGLSPTKAKVREPGAVHIVIIMKFRTSEWGTIAGQ